MSETPSSSAHIEWKDHPYSFEYLQSALDRIIGFVNSCDIKASIVLGIFGVIFSSLFSKDFFEAIYTTLSSACLAKNFSAIMYLVIFCVCAAVIFCGLCFLIIAISAKIKPSGRDSRIYFVDIAYNPKLDHYMDKFKNVSETEIVNDFLSQIYINSVICKKKYARYNAGLKLLAIGTVVFLITNLLAYNYYL